MFDIILILLGAGLLGWGLWLFSPALALVILGTGILTLAYGRHKAEKERPVTPRDAS
jgi:hypothetical protein